jgi:FlaA1/EpsC-like NDP-sugar epimerase
MKRFADYTTGASLPIKALIERGGSIRRLRHYGIAMVLGAFAVIVSFGVAVVATQLTSGMYSLPMSVIIGGSLLSFLFLGYMRMRPRASYVNHVQEINVADLLGREVVPLPAPEAQAVLRGQIILVTGAAGSIGSELCRQLLNYEPELVIALDNNETGLFDLAESLHSHPQSAHFCPHIDDITDVKRMARLFMEMRPDVVYHVAAYKHVPLLERFPDQAIRTNALATYHLCCLAQKHAVARFMFISTDKAAEPISVMGASKRVGEMIVQTMAKSAEYETRFCAVRFGNVIGSRGSVVPVFAKQIEHGGPITVTDPEATRYFMTIPEACGLVIITSAIAEQGELYLLNMGKPVRIVDLAAKMIRLRGLRMGKDISIVYTGLRPGERLHEILVAANEELTPTPYSEIYCVAHENNVPTLTTIAHWMDVLEDSLQRESNAQLRNRLFEMIQRRELIITS